MTSIRPDLKTIFRKQKTLKKEVSFSGIGIHTGVQVLMRFLPAKEETGIVFKRTDLEGKPIVPATVQHVLDTSRSTTIGIGNIRVHTVEHVLSALRAYEIDNLCIEVSNIEPPIGNGSSDVFVEMIENAGIIEQEANTPIVKLESPIYFSDGDIHLVAIPYDGYRISYTLNYPDCNLLKAQYHSVLVNEANFKQELASCRTFSLYKEVSWLMDKGLIKGGSLDNAVIIKDDAVFSKNGLFFPDEMVRHKVLDMIGDLSLVGFNFHAHIIALKSGHGANFGFAKKMYNYITMENADGS
ncbi:MAG TPA: UDP-3-O-acyl-N-acetylglucosamine deacetylase [Parachlamydiaceae bacterium]|nr:UDP-3-O-acyl-N-acetylglucosamine deacetylase [Parachlamydiaceae bacterium]